MTDWIIHLYHGPIKEGFELAEIQKYSKKAIKKGMQVPRYKPENG